MLKNCKLYVIIDRDTVKNRNIRKVARDAILGGADIIQLRDKSSDDRGLLRYARAIKNIASKYNRPFIMNDRIDIARAVDADGVHLGQGDIPIDEARKIIGKSIIGISTHSLCEALAAQKKGADYIGIGPIFKTSTKKDLRPIGLSVLAKIRKAVDIPFFAIGGISLENIEDIKRMGADRIAIVSAATKGSNTRRAVIKLKRALSK